MLTPEELLARQAQFWQEYPKAVRTTGATTLPHWLNPFRPGVPCYAMDRYFCRLVDDARRTIPGDAVFRPDMLVTSSGWLVLEEPAPLSKPGQRLQTVGWYPLPRGPQGPGGIQVASLTVHAGLGLGQPDSIWGLDTTLPLHAIEARMRQGPTAAQQLTPSAPPDPLLDEVRWFYTAVMLMANKLTLVATAPFARAVRRRAAEDAVILPDVFRRVTLRRVEIARRQAGAAGQARDWQWQWTVRGHWRHYQTGHVTYVESYIKGPVDKPLKSAPTPFFQVMR